MQIDIVRLYQKYLTLDIPNPFTLDQIHDRLTKKYRAEKVDLERFSYLRNDPYAGFDQAVGAYVFEDEQAILELIKLNKDDDIDYETMEFAWIMGSTLCGMSNVLVFEIDVFYGMEEEEMVLGNLRFKEYLIVLYLTGYIQFDNDPILDDLMARCREGYYLRHFGMQDGFERYLYK